MNLYFYFFTTLLIRTYHAGFQQGPFLVCFREGKTVAALHSTVATAYKHFVIAGMWTSGTERYCRGHS